MSQQLQHCPFCGLTDQDIINDEETPAISLHTYPGGYRVECEECACNGPWHHDLQAALDGWNSRSSTNKTI